MCAFGFVWDLGVGGCRYTEIHLGLLAAPEAEELICCS